MTLAFMIVPIYVLTPIFGIMGIRAYRKSVFQKKNAGLEAARKDSSFIETLRRLAQASEIDEYSRKKISKRIIDLEKELMGISS